MIGDNRDNSSDSRFAGYIGVGFVPYENLVGRVSLIFVSLDNDGGVRTERTFTVPQ